MRSNKCDNESSKNNIFFMDIFNQILKYNNTKVVIIFDINDKIWFKLKDLFEMFGYDAKKAKNRFQISDEYKLCYSEINNIRGALMPPLASKYIIYK
jgi:hypothetical protein